MSKISKSIAAAVIALASAGLAYAPSAAAAADPVPLTLTQQGRLLDNTGAPVDGVQLTFTFSLYTSAAAGTAIWTENQSITPDKGYFSAKIGDVTAFPANIFDGSQPTLYLGIKIGSDAEMAPRQELTSVPFALLAANALNAAHAVNADTAATATNATNAANATKAASATNADVAKAVGSIQANITVTTLVNQAAPANLTCPTGQKLIAGGCVAYDQKSSLIANGYISSKGYWVCAASAGNVDTTVSCAN